MQGRLCPETLQKLQMFPETRWRDEMPLAQSIGFAGLELLYDKEAKFLSCCVHDMSGKKIIEQWRCAGRISSLCLDFLSFHDYEDSEYWVDLLNALKVAQSMSVSVIVLPVLTINQEAQLAGFLSLINAKIPDIVAFGKTQLALEINLGALAIRKYIASFRRNHLGICFDTGNSMSHGLVPEEEISILGNLVKHIHIKDVDGQGKNVLLGEGLVDFHECLLALRVSGYSGSFVFETAYFMDPYEEARRNYQYFLNKMMVL
jgi:L-ribulose-5-phosphate 3-epimerase